MSKGFEVTVKDLDTGEIKTVVVPPGEHFILPIEPCYIDSFQLYGNGTTQYTLKVRPQG